MSTATASIDVLRYVGRKTLRKLQGRSNEHLTEAPDSDSFGRSLMEKMGWKEGSGIGKNQDGMTTHIRAKKRGAEGLGSRGDGGKYEGDNAKSCLEDGWYLKVFDDAKREKKSKKSKSKSKKRKRDDKLPSSPAIPTDEELLKATGGARLGRRAQPRGGEVGKMKRIAAADAAFLAKFHSSSSSSSSSSSTTSTTFTTSTTNTTNPMTESTSPKKKKSKVVKTKFRWKQVIRKQLKEGGGGKKFIKIKALKKAVIKEAKKSFPTLSKEELKTKFDSKWSKIPKEQRSNVRE